MLHVGGTAGVYSGSMMLFENAGGYVLLAIGAFMAGVIITVLLKRRQEKNKQNGPRETTKDKPKR
jgi:heme O synthase-like polyprenyltransferase